MYISFQDEGTMGKDWRGVIVSAVLDVSAREMYIYKLLPICTCIRQHT